jgi:tetratricopeptide (TPR) repeat protein
MLQVWRELAVVYASQGQAQDATLCVQQAQGLDPRSAATFHALGSVAQAEGNFAAAQGAYQTALALDPAHAPSLISFGESTLLNITFDHQRHVPDTLKACSFGQRLSCPWHWQLYQVIS